MKVRQTFSVAQPPEMVWNLLCDVPAIAVCVPGLDLIQQRDDETYLASFAVKVGPLSVKLDGEGVFTRDDRSRSANIEGSGIDKRGGSRATGAMRYTVVANGETSVVEVEAEFKLSGRLAQVGRTSIVEDIARSLTQEFADNIEQRLSDESSEVRVQADGVTPNGKATAGTASSPRESHLGRQSAREFNVGTALSRSLFQKFLRFFKNIFR